MTRLRLSREAAALLPWLAAALLWFSVITPMRAEEQGRLSERSRTRRERVKAELQIREATALRDRLGRALSSACASAPDPATLRQRAVLATAGLSLSSITLSVTGGAEGGALVEASGSRSSVIELTGRLGDPSRGGFLRSATLRDKGARWSVTAATGILEPVPADLLPAPPVCAAPDRAVQEAPVRQAPSPGPLPRSGRARPAPLRPAASPSLAPVPDLPPASPFTLVAFLSSSGKSRVSLRVRDEVRVISTGESIDGWTCVSIDRDEGVVFQSAAGGRIVLKAASPERLR
jgi:hypothetical protein